MTWPRAAAVGIGGAIAVIFQFEQEFIESLRCIPMAVRFRLDRCGVKLKLVHWNALTLPERRSLLEWPCGTAAEVAAYGDRLKDLVEARTGDRPKDLPIDEPFPWQIEAVPPAIRDRAAALAVTLTDDQWRSLDDLQRFALIKLSRPSHENANFGPALREFGLTAEPIA